MEDNAAAATRGGDSAVALDRLEEVVGSENLLRDPETLARYGLATFSTDMKPSAVLRPGSVAEVQACARLATETGLKLYPISTGLNTGYGDRVPTADGAVILELARLNRIVDFDPDLAYVTVEPGVTQQQLYDFLQTEGADLWLDVTGSYTAHSIIGNIAERGFGHTLYADHAANVGEFEIVLANGELLRTGFGRFDNAKAAAVYPNGVGPALHGLFTQSNLGIITRATVWLMPAPEYVQNFSCSVDDYGQLGELIDRLRPLRLDGTIPSAMHIGNDHKVVSSIMRYPWERSDGVTPLPRDLLDALKKEWDFGAWNVSGALYGTRAEVAEARRKIKKQLRGVTRRVRFLDDRALALADRFQGLYQRVTGVNLGELLKLLKPVFGMTKGIPSDDVIASTYWRKRGDLPKRPLDPVADRCGLMWLAPVGPARGECALEMWSIVERVMLAHGFEPAVSITLITGRAIDCVVSISFDRAEPGEDARALACHAELLAVLNTAGYYPYRLGVQSMTGLPASSPGFKAVVSGIKAALDPAGTLAPGRYPA